MRIRSLPFIAAFALFLLASCKSATSTDPGNPNPSDSLHGKDSTKYRLPEDLDSNISLEPTFTWKPVAGSTRYHVQVSTNPDFETNAPDKIDTVVKTASVTIPLLLESAKHFWRWRTIDSLSVGDWSDVWSFSTLITPNRVPGVGSSYTYSLDVLDSFGHAIPSLTKQQTYTVLEKDLTLFGHERVAKLGITSSSGSSEFFIQYLPNGDVAFWYDNYLAMLPVVSGGAYSRNELDSVFSDGSHMIVNVVAQNLGPFRQTVQGKPFSAQLNTLQRKSTVSKTGSPTTTTTHEDRFYWVKPLGMYSRADYYDGSSDVSTRATLLQYTLK
jgi:hypothetical protein